MEGGEHLVASLFKFLASHHYKEGKQFVPFFIVIVLGCSSYFEHRNFTTLLSNFFVETILFNDDFRCNSRKSWLRNLFINGLNRFSSWRWRWWWLAARV